MSAHHAPDWVPARSGTGIKNDGVFTTWLSLISFTFLLGTFVAANVYLRGWAPDKFNVNFGANADLPAITTIVLIIAGFITLLAGGYYRQGAWKKLQGALMLSTVAFVAYAILLIKLMVFTYELGPAAWTTHLGIYALQFALACVNIWFIIVLGFKFNERDEKSLNSWVPAAMSTFLYTVMTGIMVLVITDMIDVGQFAEWCGTRVMEVFK